jgi:type IV secretory pathway protease TraF
VASQYAETNSPISVDDIAIGTALAHDRQGRPLPVWQGCRAIAQGEVFLMNWDEPASFDSRYFGPIPLRTIIGRASLCGHSTSHDHALRTQIARDPLV